MEFATRHPSQDRPVTRDRDDKLDRGPFVASLVRTLVRDATGPDGRLAGRSASGFVVGLTGKWGLGKSSILRLLQLELGSMDRVIVSYFNPWLFNGRDELMRGFFNGLRAAIGGSNVEHARELADALDRYWGAIDLAGHTVAAVVDLHGAAGAATTFWSNWGKRAKGALPKSKKLSPEDERKSLEQKIAKHKVAVIVLIDELDRVEDDEVKAVAQLVKAAGDIEGISYLVAYDPERVADALGRGSGAERQASGARYLEKIIQLPIPLRPLFDEDVEKLLDAELLHCSVLPPTVQAENQQAILAQIKKEISTPRDIKRLVGAFAVLERATRGEIEPVDVLAYAWILTKAPALRDTLMNQFDRVVSDPGEREIIAELARRLDNKNEAPAPSEILGECAAPHSELLKLLFPRFHKDHDAQDDGSRLHRRRNMVRLLYLGNPPGAIARTEIEAIWQIAELGEMEASLRKLLSSGKLVAFIDRLDDLLSQLPPSGDLIFWPALSKVLTRSTDWMTSPTPEYSLVDDVATMLTRLGLRDRLQVPRVKVVVDALIESRDLAIVPWILRKQMYAHGLSKHHRRPGGESIYTKEETLELMRQETLRYRAAVLDGSALRRLPNVEAIFVIGNQDGWDEKLRTALTQQLKSRDALATMAALLLPPGHGSERQSLAELFDPDEVARALSEANFDDPPLEPWVASAVKQFKVILAGRDPHFDDEDDEISGVDVQPVPAEHAAGMSDASARQS